MEYQKITKRSDLYDYGVIYVIIYALLLKELVLLVLLLESIILEIKK